jgi:tRNA (guanine37-N1)-methyltransferase
MKKIKFDIITIFPDILKCYFNETLLKKAIEKGIIEVKIHNLRDYSLDIRKSVDDKPFGGGRGMVIKIEPILKAVSSLTKLELKGLKLKPKDKGTKIILFSPRGKKFNQKMAFKFSKLKHLILISGRYEGIDERIAKYLATDIISIGDYVLMGGEIPALVLVESISRLVPGVVGKSDLLLSERVTKNYGFIEFPQFTRPEIFYPGKILKKIKKNVKWRVPKILLSGDHKKIQEWRERNQKIIE